VERDEERRYRRYVQKNMVSEVIFQRLFYKDNLTDDLAEMVWQRWFGRDGLAEMI
jgi:hypothetical protein